MALFTYYNIFGRARKEVKTLQLTMEQGHIHIRGESAMSVMTNNWSQQENDFAT